MTKENIIVISSANDYIVPTKLTDNLAQKLNADYYRKKESGHFMGIDGYKTFSLLFTLLNYLLKNKK
ncbi:serine hydrolase [Liquorilactobacillus mali]|nr:serine hydrolase [Liquorilactobacillus mali]